MSLIVQISCSGKTVRNRQAGFITNFETFLIKKFKYVNTPWRAADNWSEGRQLDSPNLEYTLHQKGNPNSKRRQY
jgi:hypothetical protein